MNDLLLVFLGGGFGSVLRYLISISTKHWLGQFPIHTLIANFIATLCLAFLFYMVLKGNSGSWMNAAVLVGFCGGLSTFSTFSFETFYLLKESQINLAIANIFANIALCLFIVYILYKLIPNQ